MTENESEILLVEDDPLDLEIALNALRALLDQRPATRSRRGPAGQGGAPPPTGE